MNAETTKIKNRLSSLTSSFDELETLLEPLFAQTLPETLVGLEPLQQAKLQTVLPYVVYDLIFIYLKSRGIDPKTHPVIPELVRMLLTNFIHHNQLKHTDIQDRIRQYFEKINNAENPPAKRTELDKAAASRFIKHAISQAQWKKTAAETAQDAEDAPTPTQRVPVKVTEKMLERAAYEKELKSRAAEDDEEETLQVFEGAEGDDEDGTKMDVDTTANDLPSRSSKGKGKEVSANSTLNVSNKRRRPAIDPFAGYGDDSSLLSSDTPSTIAGNKQAGSSDIIPSLGSAAPQNAPPDKSKRSSKKINKKAKK